jgi:hypothetical protein
MYLMCKLLTIGTWDSFVYILGGRVSLLQTCLTMLGMGVNFVSKNLTLCYKMVYNTTMQTENDLHTELGGFPNIVRKG